VAFCDLTFFLFILGTGFVCLDANQDQRQKVAEGVYTKLIKDAVVKGSEQTWTLWRLTDGSYELEDHFQLASNAAEQLAAELGGDHVLGITPRNGRGHGRVSISRRTDRAHRIQEICGFLVDLPNVYLS